MLYELALPALLMQGACRWLRNGVNPERQVPALRLRVARARLRRLEISLLDHISLDVSAALLLRRFHRNQSETPTAVASAATEGDIFPAHFERRGGLYWRRFGPSYGPRVLLVHGWNADGRMMLPLARQLVARGYCVDLPDLPGTGRSRGRVRSFIEVARRLRAACTDRPAYDAVIGHSAGGLVAMIALGLGLGSKRLVTLCAPSSLARLMTLYLRFTGQPGARADVLLRRYERTCGRALSGIGPLECRSLTQPHLVLHARHDWQVPPREAEAICALRDGLEPRYLNACNHRSILRHPELADLLERFFLDTRHQGGGVNAAYR